MEREIENLRREIEALKVDVQEIKSILLPLSHLLEGNGFKLAIVLFASGVVIALVGISHLVSSVAQYIIQLLRAIR